MRTIYIDSEFKCHVTNDGTMTAVETDFFDGKCDVYIEGFRLVPPGETRMSPDGTTYEGISPWKDMNELDSIQRDYERERLADAEKALAILLGGEV